ncbi:hypothetical protein [Peribacillus frigoritolerans]|uniref:hypothetical protein n=1 Tax=Peribacillus frigoritolerans TaxID=450367 RepID=UPI001059F67E|nr:hypothetical protein [Peribacillus frigoritolerans]TDL78921.1 hypothetical protein E2R53_15880 [Peribacillus frigoritolerans]
MINANKSLTQSEYELFYSYNELLNFIEEDLHYLIQSIESMEYTEGERVMDDLVDAFIQIDTTHSGMFHLAGDDEYLQNQILLFDQIIEELKPFTLNKDDAFLFQIFIKEELSVLFLQWKREVQAYLMPYILQ